MERFAGSSPLARGLREGSRDRDRDVRIIPARAGFTAKEVEIGIEMSDHPRSRGVYANAADKDGKYQGSSPLARGLPDDVGANGWGRRIIPARAGFTVILLS